MIITTIKGIESQHTNSTSSFIWYPVCNVEDIHRDDLPPQVKLEKKIRGIDVTLLKGSKINGYPVVIVFDGAVLPVLQDGYNPYQVSFLGHDFAVSVMDVTNTDTDTGISTVKKCIFIGLEDV